MSLTEKQLLIASKELNLHLELLGYDEDKIMSDLKFTKEQLHNTLELNRNSQPVDVWILKDYLEEKLVLEGKVPKPSVVFKRNIHFPYKKYW